MCEVDFECPVRGVERLIKVVFCNINFFLKNNNRLCEAGGLLDLVHLFPSCESLSHNVDTAVSSVVLEQVCLASR